MAKEYKYQGEMFSLDDSKGCYIEVKYKEQRGYVGVYLKGTAEQPFCWYDSERVVAKDGLSVGNSNGRDLDVNLHALCAKLLANHRQARARKAFKPEEVCKSLHEFVQALPT